MHLPVFLKEAVECLNLCSGKNFIDATIGGGGHSFVLLKKIKPQGKILGIEADPKSFQKLKEKIRRLGLEKRLFVVNDNFVNLKKIVKENNFFPVDGIFFDLGLSSDLIKESGRGFSFMNNEALDMRFNPYKKNLTAAQILNQFKKEELKEIFKTYGGEKYAGRIAEKIVKERKNKKIILTKQLVRLIKEALGRHYHIKSLARVFQSLRIVVNNELENLKKALSDSLSILSLGGVIIVISYHSGEDKIVKDFFKNQEKLKPFFKKPLIPSLQEIASNKRARSAKLRAAQKISN